MKGKYKIRIQNKRIRYDFEITRNITIIQGNSATGKTTLIDMIREYHENGMDSGIELSCTVPCAVLEGKNWKILLSSYQNSILFIDEGNRFVSSQEFAELIHESSNYFVIVTRESLPMLPYSVEEIYGIRNAGKYGGLKRTFNELYHVYRQDTMEGTICPKVIITEDSNAGFEFFETVGSSRGILSISSGGKSNLFTAILKHKAEKVLVIADGAAIGSEMNKLGYLLQIYTNIILYLPESFEWLILKSGVLNSREIDEILESPSDFIDNLEYISWERYFTALLTKRTNGTYLAYDKRKLNPAYKAGSISKKILAVMKNIEIS